MSCVKSLDCRSHLPAKRGRKPGMTLPITKVDFKPKLIRDFILFFFKILTPCMRDREREERESDWG